MTNIRPGASVSWSSGYDSKTLHGKVIEVFTKDGQQWTKVRIENMVVPFQVLAEKLTLETNCS